MKKIAFVCYGNICRSPMAQAVMQDKLDRVGLTGTISVDSFATGSHEQGNNPHPGTINELHRHGLSIDHQSTPITDDIFEQYDLLIAMDDQNMDDLNYMKPTHSKATIKMIMSVVPGKESEEIPDPWYTHKFKETFEMVDEATDYWLNKFETENQTMD